jgi:3-hydroxyacyl-[acyl-carrier-protein] dehydratase
MPKVSQLLNRAQIEARIPHRAPILWLTSVSMWEANTSLTAHHTFKLENEPHIHGHFPGNPIVPGVFMVEALAQASSLLTSLSKNLKAEQTEYLFVGIEEARFSHIARPGDELTLHVEQMFEKRSIFKFKGTATNRRGQTVMTVTFHAKLTVKAPA